jgi:hypothetical protein
MITYRPGVLLPKKPKAINSKLMLAVFASNLQVAHFIKMQSKKKEALASCHHCPPSWCQVRLGLSSLQKLSIGS